MTQRPMNLQTQEYSRRIVQGLHENWYPHKFQQKILLSLFRDLFTDIWVEAGRKFGKTELVLYVLWRFALLYSNAGCYYFAPLQKMAREIIWSTNRIQRFGPKEFVKGINNTDMRITFVNGSFIKLDGSDQYDSYIGIQPHVAVYDEFRKFRPEFHQVFNPNRKVFKAPLVRISTPAPEEGYYYEELDWFRKQTDTIYHHFTSFENPYIDPKELLKEKDRLVSRGELYVWEREYLAKKALGGASSIFPMFSDEIMLGHETLMFEVQRNIGNILFFLAADPATMSTFGVLFGCINRETKKIYILDEIYEQEMGKTSVGQIMPRIQTMRRELAGLKEWHNTYDEAESWWLNEIVDRYGHNEIWSPTHKSLSDKEEETSKIKDVILCGNMVVSKRCEKFKFEMQNYMRDKNGKLPKDQDHLIDCLRYLLAASHYFDIWQPGDNIYSHETGEKLKLAIDHRDPKMVPIEKDFPQIFEDYGDLFLE